MDNDLYNLYAKKAYIIGCVIAITLAMFIVWGRVSYVVIAVIFITVNICDYYAKKSKLRDLHTKYKTEQLTQLHTINFGY